MNTAPQLGEIDFNSLPDLGILGQTLFSKVPIGTVVARLSDHRIILCNPAFSLLAAVRIETIADLIHPSFAAQNKQDTFRPQIEHEHSQA